MKTAYERACDIYYELNLIMCEQKKEVPIDRDEFDYQLGAPSSKVLREEIKRVSKHIEYDRAEQAMNNIIKNAEDIK